MYNQRFHPKQRQNNRRFAPKQLPNHELMAAINAVKIVNNEKLNIPEEVFVPKNGFVDFNIVQQLKDNIAAKQYVVPTPIQDQAIDHMLAGRDVIGIANTGTGKTAAFLIPLINKVFLNKSEKVLIIAPTRELALQIQEELRDFSKGLGIRSVLCIGGMSLWRQKNELRQSNNFVIGTPGRIKELIGERSLLLSTFHSVVLDEADRMVDIGFINDIKYFISLLPQNRQSLFFSATISGKVREILNAFVQNPVTISVEKQATAENVEQDIIKITNKNEKIDKLHDLLSQQEFEKVLVFGRTKWGMQKLTNELIRRGIRAAVIHGNKSQGQRQKALEQFKTNQISVLLATDVASRGLDIPDVTHVINYDMPATYDDYVHRIGRTGRAGKKGIALTFVE
ncbi:MAG TPA: DEAD/DEAH box helicase [Patescibacteria group bacterium]|jgi:superfamily II DNA/RNA helicase|nr:DEAD/DEAH box helicase [Patescibacteria group bacterium]